METALTLYLKFSSVNLQQIKKRKWLRMLFVLLAHAFTRKHKYTLKMAIVF